MQDKRKKKRVLSYNEDYCKRCVYNIYKKADEYSPYPCGKKVCTPLLEEPKKVENPKVEKENIGRQLLEIQERRRTERPKKMVIENPVDMGNGYIKAMRPKKINRKISKTEVIKMAEKSEVSEVKKDSAPIPVAVKSVSNDKPSALGVDVGTAFIVGAQYNKEQQIETLSIRDGFYKMDSSKQKRNMLASSNVSYMKMENELFVIGNEAFDMAVLFEQKLRRPMKDGVLSADESECEPIVREILRQAVGDAKNKGDIIYYSVPADPVDSTFDIIYHEAKFKDFFKQLGYNPDNVFPLNEAMAIVNSELADTMFTGLAISFGAGMTNVAMSYRGLEIFSFSVARGGDWIDKEVAQNRQISLSDAAATKESEEFNLLDPSDIIEDAISIFYTAHLEYVIGNIVKNLNIHKRKIKLKEKLKVVLSGGTSKPKGFIKLFEQQIEKNPWGIDVGEVKHASNPLDAVARGCLIAAQRDLLDIEEG